ncbi:MAG: hypothetical protein JNK85_06335 [Verrucomicrobiales bacterium]|nr:hypothetical protein [Verrucomicrobiales bacterium]
MSVNWRILACHRHRRDLSLVATGLLTEADAPLAIRHLTDCTECQRRFAQWRAIERLRAKPITPDPDIVPSRALRERWTREILKTGSSAFANNERVDAPAPWALGMLMRQPAGLLATAWLLIAFFWFSAPRISKAPGSEDGLTWGQVIAVLQPPPLSSPEVASPAAPPPPRTNDLSPGPLGQNLREPSNTHGRKA